MQSGIIYQSFSIKSGDHTNKKLALSLYNKVLALKLLEFYGTCYSNVFETIIFSLINSLPQLKLYYLGIKLIFV